MKKLLPLGADYGASEDEDTEGSGSDAANAEHVSPTVQTPEESNED
jgi:hypothetical protein